METLSDRGKQLRIFVYGTLKRGFSNHESYCNGVSRIIPANIRGRLFKLTPGIPVMIIPAGDILARGSADPVADIRLQEGFNRGCGALPESPQCVVRGAEIEAGSEEPRRAGGRRRVHQEAEPGFLGPAGEWKTINGELLFFDDPETRLSLIDGLEEFRPAEPSTYFRVLVRVALADGSPSIAWTYIAGFDINGLEHFEGESWFPDEWGGETTL